MANPFYAAIGGSNQPDIMRQFQRFMQQMQGRNPRMILDEFIASGRISQSQLDAAQRQAHQLAALFNPPSANNQ